VGKARLTEVSQAMSTVASALSAYRQDNNVWPGLLDTTGELRTSLGVSVATGRYIRAVTIAADTGVIAFGVSRTGDPSVDAGSLVMSPSITTDLAVVWTWSASAGFPAAYIPTR